MDGITRISNAFQVARQAGRAALMPYLTLGFPNPDLSLSLVEAVAHSGADLIELGVPFSDPLADGPTIQHSTQVALQQGMSVVRCLEMVSQLRRRGLVLPLMLMGYLNPLLAYGIDRFVADAVRAGADGLIVPDLPLEESQELAAACHDGDLGLVFLAPPNASPQRLASLARITSGFFYLVSVKGVTGARSGLPDLDDFILRARAAAHTPVAVGFGIATPAQAAAVGRIADGVIVGSAVIDTIAAHPKDPIAGLSSYIKSLAEAVAHASS